MILLLFLFFFSSRRRHTRSYGDWSSDVCSSDLSFSAASCTLDATGKCTVNYTPTAVGTGTHKLTGSYGGDAKHATSTGSFDEAVGRQIGRASWRGRA